MEIWNGFCKRERNEDEKKIKTTKARESKKGGQKRKSYLATFDGW